VRQETLTYALTAVVARTARRPGAQRVGEAAAFGEPLELLRDPACCDRGPVAVRRSRTARRPGAQRVAEYGTCGSEFGLSILFILSNFRSWPNMGRAALRFRLAASQIPGQIPGWLPATESLC